MPYKTLKNDKYLILKCEYAVKWKNKTNQNKENWRRAEEHNTFLIRLERKFIDNTIFAFQHLMKEKRLESIGVQTTFCWDRPYYAFPLKNKRLINWVVKNKPTWFKEKISMIFFIDDKEIK